MNNPNDNNDQIPFFQNPTFEKPITALEERQQLLAHHVRLVARKHNHALFVFGAQGGLGKSRTILQILDQENIEPVLINSHVTPLAFYSILFRYRSEEVIFMDDVDSAFSSMAHLGLLRSALWGSPRVVTYGSSQLPSDLPSSFETTARFIFAANVIPKKNDAFKAVLSRCDIFELSATNEEVVDLMRSVSQKGFHQLTPEDCGMVIDYIAENSDDRQLSMRLLGPSLRKLLYARGEGIDWQPMIKSQLSTLGRKDASTKRLDSKTKDLRILQNAIQKHPDSVQEQEKVWRQVTGKSRASFYRCLQRLRAEHNE
ncbi:hypothetical protein [Gimesia chilikensis]|uniref:Uncharacterized protein n=1 Tax=Gimesia chilikensis TaxID=2605989 RepID=A0A517PYJ2_9PLAN|nr:hypothetical protein [Gimesia chilikensis]QDT24382.1 hypothetical protein HG66A1_62140 [Gimesia chilikensis]